MPNRSFANALLAAVLLSGGADALAQAQKRTPSQQPGTEQPAAQQPAGPQPIIRANFLAQMDAQFGRIDADKNGQLTRTEIEQFEKDKALAERLARNEALFEQLDTNKNGQLSAKEFAKQVTAPPQPSATPMLLREDSNRDGQVSLVEHRISTLTNFDRLDSDKDGVVSAAEMKAGGIAPR